MRRLAAVLGVLASVALAPAARGDDAMPPAMAAVDVVEHLGDRVPADLAFVDHLGKPTTLGAAIGHGRPLLVTLAYHRCRMLCSLVLSGLARTMRDAGVVLGRDVDALTVSVDPAEDLALAAEKRRGELAAIGAADEAGAWPFFAGRRESIDALAEALGFRYARDRDTGEIAHAAVVFVLTPDGRISRYLYGIGIPARDLRLAVAEAAEGRSGTSFDRLLLHCYRWDPATRRYAPFLAAYFRTGGTLILGALAALLFRMHRRELARRRAEVSA